MELSILFTKLSWLSFLLVASKLNEKEEVSLLLKSEECLRSISTSNELSSEKYRLSMLF